MANRVKHEDKVLEDILKGRETRKKIFVPVEDREFKKELKLQREKEQKKRNEISEVLQEARMPWFCPECKKVMKKRLDDKFWRLRKKCFDCVVEEETEMRINGTWKEYEQKIVNDNVDGWLKDQEGGFEEWKKQVRQDKSFVVNKEGAVENWKSPNAEELIKNMEKEFENMRKYVLESVGEK